VNSKITTNNLIYKNLKEPLVKTTQH